MNNRQKMVQQQFLNNEEAVIKRLNQVYRKSLSDVQDKIKNLQFDIGRLQAEYDWLDPDDPEKAKVKSQIQSKIYQKKYQEQLQSQLDGILKQMQNAQYLTVAGYLDECYTDGFIGSIFDLSGQGVPLMMPINQESMVHAVQLDSKISRGLYTRLGEDVELLKKKITAQVSRSIATGETYKQTARQLANYTSIGYNNAIRIARTEGHRIQTTAQMDAMHGAKDRGADLVKQWDAALDARTRESHVNVDGEWREIDEKFSNGLRYPGDPHGKAAEVINCRCALLQRARWALADGFTKIDGFTDEIKSFDSMETYDEFKKAYFSSENRAYMEYVTELEKQYGTKDLNKILSKMTDEEYQYFAKLEKARPQFSGMYRNDPIVKKGANLLTNSPNGVKMEPVNPDPVDISALRTELQGISQDIARVQKDIGTERRSLYYGADKDAVDQRIMDLQKELEALKAQQTATGKVFVENMNTTFKVSTDNEKFISMIVDLDSKVEYREVMMLPSVRSAEDIIKVLGGGDTTSGSCASVGLGYIGQKNGWDVLDFRGGSSMDFFSSKENKIKMWDALGITPIIEDSGKSNITNGKRILAKMEKGKEYYLSVGRHASIVRKNDDGVMQYLELQSSKNSGWTNFNGNIGYTLKNRFGCSSSSNYYSTAYLTDIEAVKDSAEFRTILGYINTAEDKQRKGSYGTIK